MALKYPGASSLPGTGTCWGTHERGRPPRLCNPELAQLPSRGVLWAGTPGMGVWDIPGVPPLLS